MDKKDLIEYRKKYEKYRHHAWAGLGFLSIVLAVRYFVPSITDFEHIFLSIVIILIIYILVSLILTYRYSAGLAMIEEENTGHLWDELEKEKIRAKLEKKKIKLEKKRLKAEEKKRKKLREK